MIKRSEVTMRLTIASSMAALLLIASTGASAHHSFAMFDQSRDVTLRGTVREFQWTNPHAFVHLAVKDAAGEISVWRVELNSPNNLRRQGWRSTTLRTGDAVTLVLHPLRDGGKGGLFVSVTLPSGGVLRDPTRVPGKP